MAIQRRDGDMTLREQLLVWFKGDQEAAELGESLWDACQLWDDIVDESRADLVNSLMSFMTFRLSMQPFFRRHEVWIRPVMLNVYLKWRDANVLEATGEAADLEKAFMLRAGIYDLFAVIAWVVGGEGWSQQIGPEIRRSYGERLADFIEEKSHA